MRALQIAICVLSMVAIFVAGKIGEELLAGALLAHGQANVGTGHLGTLSALVLDNYRLNQGHFLLSLAPLFLVLAAIGFLDRHFWHALAIAWLVFAGYFALFAYALIAPFTHVGLAADHQPTLVTWLAILDSAIVATIILVVYFRSRRRP